MPEDLGYLPAGYTAQYPSWSGLRGHHRKEWPHMSHAVHRLYHKFLDSKKFQNGKRSNFTKSFRFGRSNALKHFQFGRSNYIKNYQFGMPPKLSAALSKFKIPGLIGVTRKQYSRATARKYGSRPQRSLYRRPIYKRSYRSRSAYRRPVYRHRMTYRRYRRY